MQPPRHRSMTTKDRADIRALLAALAGGVPTVALDIDGHSVAVTNLDRVYWPAEPAADHEPVTKRTFVRYLVTMSPLMLPSLADRPLTIFRWPEGLTWRRVLQRHWDIALPPFVDRVRIFSEAKGHDDEYILCNNLATLVWLGQMGALEIHVWHSRTRPGRDAANDNVTFSGSIANLDASVLNFPDYLLFDLDPYIYSGKETRRGEPEPTAAGFAKVKDVAFQLKDLLDSMALESIVKTSGKTGLHVVVPIRRSVDYDVVRGLARVVGTHLLRRNPALITTEWSVEKRRGKVFFDYNMNARGKSISAAYGPRGLSGAPVSMPLAWRDLERAEPGDFTLTRVLAKPRRRVDPWARVRTHKQDLVALLKNR